MVFLVVALIALSFNLVKMDYNIDDFIKLYFLEGEWVMPYKEGELVEKWNKKSDKILDGETFYFKENQKLSLENITLRLKDARIFYTANVKDNNESEPVPFTLIEIDKNKFIFQNKEHDFPQRIIYEIKSYNEFTATVEGETDNGEKKIVYNFKKK